MTDETRPETSEPETSSTATAPEAETPPQPEQEPEETAEGGADNGEEGGEEKLTLTQTVDMQDIGPCKKHIKITVDRAAIDKELNKKFSELRSDANVPGFRPGKAPRKVIERRYHREVTDQVKTAVLMQSLEQLAEEHKVAPLSVPDLDPTKVVIPEDGPLIYEFDVEVRPEFDLPNYKGLKLRRPVRTFNDQDVEEEERRILGRVGQLVPKPEGNAQVGDYLICDIHTHDGGRTISDLKEVKLRIEPRLAFKDAVVENFGAQMKGAHAGQTRSLELTLSESSADPGLQGKKVQAEFAIHDVKTMRLPEVTHELLHEFGVHSREQLRERIRVLLQWRLEYLQRESARQQVLEQIDAASRWELPEDLLARQAHKALARKIIDMRSSGMSEEEIRGRRRLLEQDVLKSTALALKEHFVLQKIAEVENIDISEDDLNEEIERMAEQAGESARRVRARLEREDSLDALATEMVERKALDLILQSAEYEDVPVGAQEEAPVATVEEQAVPGEMQDPTAVPPPAPEAPAGETAPPAQG